jgi:protein lifeguard
MDNLHDRLSFIRKVYSILSIQLLLTFGTVSFCSLNENARLLVQQMPMGLFIGAIVIAFITEILMLCVRPLARSVPTNYILLAIFTVCETIFVTYFTTFYDPMMVCVAMGMTTAITVGLSIYACKTQTDLTMCGGLMWSVCIAMILLTFSSFFLSAFVEWWHPFASAICVVFFGLFLVYDT